MYKRLLMSSKMKKKENEIREKLEKQLIKEK